MIGMILVGHGEFAKGLTSSVELLLGPQEDYIILEFPQDMSEETLTDNIRNGIEKLDNCEEIIILSDILGGTPFKSSVIASIEYKNIYIVTGTNLPLLLSILIKRGIAVMSILDVINESIVESKESIIMMDKSIADSVD